MPRKLQFTYYPWITQSISGGALATAIKSFADIARADLRTRLGEAVSIDVLPEMDVSDQIAHIEALPGAGTDGVVALMNPLGYAAAHESVPGVVAITVVRRQIPGSPAGPTYSANLRERTNRHLEA